MSRKTLADVALTLATAAFAAGAQAQTQQPAPAAPAAPAQPPYGTTKVEGTDNVYIFRNVNHQSMFIVTNDGAIATDPIAYGRPTGGQAYVDAIKKVTDKPIKYLIYSHHHYDHIAGGKAFKDAGARIIAHERVTERLAPLGDPNTMRACPRGIICLRGCGGHAACGRLSTTESEGRSSRDRESSTWLDSRFAIFGG